MATKKKSSRKKNFVLDTNVILHDYECLDKFEENDIFIPITVLEELDNFKKGSDQINFNARAFVRKLDSLADQDFFRNGASLGNGLGRLFVYVNGAEHPAVQKAFAQHIPDHRILSAAMNIAAEDPNEITILVTKDVNLRLKAKSLGMAVEDYYNDKVAGVDYANMEQSVYDGIDPALVNQLYSSPNGLDADALDFYSKLEPNQSFILKSTESSVLARFDPFAQKIIRVDKRPYMGISPRNAEQAFALDVLADHRIKLVGLTGKAGTGKTLLALAAALDAITDSNTPYDQVLLSRPIVALSNKDLGFLPGDEKSKITPYMQPLFDNLNFIKTGLRAGEIAAIDRLQRDEKLVIEALAYVRGRSISNSIVIVDEAQNLTPHEVKTIITRAAENTKIIFTGDIEQIDSPYLDQAGNGLTYMIDRMKGENLFAHVNLLKGERSELSELASHLL